MRGLPIAAGAHPVAPGHEIHRPRGLGEWTLWLTVRGRCRIQGCADDIISSAGELILYQPRVLQLYGTRDLQDPWYPLWAVFAPLPHWLPRMSWPEIAKGVMRLGPLEEDARVEVQSAFEELLAALQPSIHDGEAWAMHHLERILLHCDAANPLRRSGMDPRVREAVQYLAARIQSPPSLGAVAAAVHLSPPHLCRLFKEQLGTPPLAYLEQLRLGKGAELLKYSSLSVKEVAGELGYHSSFYFSARFRHRFGKSPQQFRHDFLEKSPGKTTRIRQGNSG